MKTINIAFGIHNHQPTGNFDFVFEEAYQKAYLPFLEMLERHPQIRMAQHYTGILLQWIKEHKPEFMPRLRKLVERGQIEMMTGGFYEPIMSVIPYCDKVGQIKKLTKFIKNSTGYNATGMWLAERIWEPHLPKPVAVAGVEYLVLDDSHFKNAGLIEAEMLGYYLTEEEGHTVFLFPISEKLRYSIPFEPPEITIEYLRSIATEDGQTLVVFADDGEKFGIWPNTHQHCYLDGWLERFFHALEENSDWINILHLSEAIELLQPRGRVYLPTASYREMMEWAMPTTAINLYGAFEETLLNNELLEKFRVFVRGGFWRNFMVKYPESNNMHKKMLHLSKRLELLDSDFGKDTRFKQAQDHLWAGQCNCPYWHGVFGGLYLNHLRYATYQQFIAAEKLLDDLLHPDGAKQGWLDVVEKDIDCDGKKEVLLSNPNLSLLISPHLGGAIYELDFKPKTINLMDTMTRREESYHKKLQQTAHSMKTEINGHHSEKGIASIHDMVVVKEEGLDKLLFYDTYRRMSGLDHFFGEDTCLEKVSQSRYEEIGNFLEQPYECQIEQQADEVLLQLRRQGAVVTAAGETVPVLLKKQIRLGKTASQLNIYYSITNQGDARQSFWFASEWDFSLLAGDAPDRYFVFPGIELEDARLRSAGEITKTVEARLVDEWLKLSISLKLSAPCSVWRFPIETISQSEAGFERVYQSSVVLPNWKFELQPEESWETELELTIDEL